MVNLVISPSTTYVMCTIKLPIRVTENIGRAMKQCVWQGNDQTKGGSYILAHDIKTQRERWTWCNNSEAPKWCFFIWNSSTSHTKADVPWVQLIWTKYYSNKIPYGTWEVGFLWKDILRFNVMYRCIARCLIGDGSVVLFWEDLWIDGILSHEFPQLYSFATYQHISVKRSMEAEYFDNLFSLPLFIQASEEYQLLPYNMISQ